MTIARQLGSGGEEVAALVGQRLNARVLDRELLQEAADRSGVPLATLEDLDERGRSMLRRPRDLFRLVPLPPINPELPDVTGDRYPPTGPVRARGEGLISPAYWAAEAYATLLARTMQALAASEDAVLVGRAANEALAGTPGTLHVLVLATEVVRLRRLMAAEQMDGAHALERIRESDRRRAAYARQFYRADWLDPSRYDLSICTDHTSAETVAELIVQAVERAAGQEGKLAVQPAAAAH